MQVAYKTKKHPPTKDDAPRGYVLAARRNVGGFHTWSVQSWKVVAKESAIFPWWAPFPVIPTT